MKGEMLLRLVGCAGLLVSGCTTRPPGGAAWRSIGQEPAARCGASGLSAELAAKILSLNPEEVTQREIKELLSSAPAPHILKIHGGLFPIKTSMRSFSGFLIGMGYPEASLRDPGSGDFTYGHYDRSEKIAGTAAWYYEREGLRPMLVGHSVGGIQVVRILHQLAGTTATRLPVWNPETGREEQRHEITDPLTGMKRPVVGLQLSYATVSLAGGMARLPPNQWDMKRRLRQIPDSVVEFTGFQKGLDFLGGDFMGYGPANHYHPTGCAIVRNVRLPSMAAHTFVPYTKSLLRNPQTIDWINRYHPAHEQINGANGNLPFGAVSAHVLWAAEVWYSIKKHWVIELQRLIKARLANPDDR